MIENLKNKLEYNLIIVYCSILNLIYGIHPLSIIIFLAIYTVFCLKDKSNCFLFPFIIFPFQFLIRVQQPNDTILVLLPEFTILVSIFCYFLHKGIKLPSCNLNITLLLMIYCINTFLTNIINLPEITYFPILIRQNILPIILLIIFINVDYYYDLSKRAFKLSILSYFLISVIVILNITETIRINPINSTYYPFLDFNGSWISDNYEGRKILGYSIPRINLFVGGAIGSAAAIFFAIGLLPFFLKIEIKNLLYKLAGMALIFVSLFTLSYSIVIPLCLFIYIRLTDNKYFKLFSAIVILFFIYILNLDLFMNKSTYEYFSETSFSGFLDFTNSINIVNILIGVGPRVIADGFYFVPENFIIDVGILRVFVETGIINFLVFLIILFIILIKGIYNLKYSSDVYSKYSVLLFLTFILTVHANMTAFPPFYPLYVSVVGLIINSYKNKNFTKYNNHHL